MLLCGKIKIFVLLESLSLKHQQRLMMLMVLSLKYQQHLTIKQKYKYYLRIGNFK